MTRTTLNCHTSPNFRTTPEGGLLATAYDLTCYNPIYTADPHTSRSPVSYPEPSGPEAETLPIGHISIVINLPKTHSLIQ
ncbi:hypothetical protein AVEN_26422-1 [Araneus ventricosus]|uniref:Uncharacterized protein n=1 Tax=Araneus ventricosus TaxID=182803 RepID=A0A4Y2UFR5_ARAVE|nr:hypothetical protein AVEN_26422-1 [Araneus ventricosus]